MYYQVYLDVFFVQEMIVNFYVLELLRICLMSTATHRKLIFAAAFAGLYQVILLCIPFPENLVIFYVFLLILYAFGSVLTLRIAFGKQTMLVYIKQTAAYMTMLLCVGGMLTGLLPKLPFYKNSKVKLLFLGVAGAFVYVLLYALFRKRRQNNYYGRLKLRHKDVSLEGTFFMDSGNGLIETISGKPVLIADRQWLFNALKEEELLCRPVIYKSLGKEKGVLYAYDIDELVIYGEKRTYTYEKVWVGVYGEKLFDKGDCQVILPLFYGTHYE